MEENYLFGLNSEQKKAVVTTEGPLLILAGAGAGKTKTITFRIYHLIKNGTDPKQILAITFTNKAAKEMRERVDRLLEKDRTLNLSISFGDKPFISTFHALAVHLLRNHASEANLPRHFKIFDGGDSRKAIREAIEKVNLNPKEIEPAKLQHSISREKGNACTLEKYREKVGNEYFPNIVEKVWTEYEHILKQEKALDFDDLLLKAYILLKENETIRTFYQKLWKYIHVDEYQDTNRIQYLLVRLLGIAHNNVCVVGDADQNIYSWRGAELRNILDFEKDYPEAQAILLEENYRSTQTILHAANTIIKKNKLRKEKELFTKNSIGEKIGLFEGIDENEEAEFVASKTENCIKEGIAPKEIAVLYRANFQSRVLEEAFLSKGIAYQLIGVKFFERKEIKDVLAFIHAAFNRESFGDIKRIINVPPRGIGKVTLLKIFEGKESTLPKGTFERVVAFRLLLNGIHTVALEKKPSEVIKYIIKKTGIEEMYETGKEKDEEKLENVRELVTLATRYDTYPTNEGLEKLLSDAALLADQDELAEEKDGVKLMTVHAAKGLEFDYVFIVGLEDNLFPHQRSNESKVSDEENEEERRLFYVALTRARKRVILSYAQMRTLYGSKNVSMPSEFITDIPEESIEKISFTADEKYKRGIASIFSIEF
ncbi:MAG: UvrD-helicase domain-containing protein [Patescibacteria group bacterium]